VSGIFAVTVIYDGRTKKYVQAIYLQKKWIEMENNVHKTDIRQVS